MARRRPKESSLTDELFALLLSAPVWVGPCLAAIAFVVMRWVLPTFFMAGTKDHELTRSGMKVFATLSHGFSPWAGGLILMVWVAAEIKKLMRRGRLERQTGTDSIRTLDWREFEALLAEAFKRQGFTVDHCGAAGPDGGIDLRLGKAGALTLVQCKHWRERQVGVRVVRELLGVITSEGAQGGIIVTSGSFTPDAIDFASKNPIRLIDGRELVKMVGQAQRSGRISEASPSSPAPAPMTARMPSHTRVATSATSEPVVSNAAPTCPLCASPMVRRVAKRGPNAGSAFLGCSRYPNCRGTAPLAPGQM
jgi:restriction system protein